MREDYRLLVDELPGLAAALGEELAPDALGDTAVLVAAVDCVDRAVDDADARERVALRREIVEALRGVVIEGELGARLAALHERLRTAEIVEPFAAVAVATLANTERMRRTRSVREYIAHAEREGVLLVDMTLLVLGTRAGPALRRFLYAVSGPANLWDKLRDARDDHRNGELAIPPSLAFHARLLGRLVAGLPTIVRAHPRPTRLVRWAARWF